jgi:small basic protein (TIGR04137 family)
MSIDRSLKIKSALVRHRNVLTRAERIERLKKEEKWVEGDTLLGLPKVANRKIHAKKEAKAVKEGVAEAAVPGTEAVGKAPAGDAKAKAGEPKGKAAEPKGKAAEAKPKAGEGKKAEGKK